MKEEISSVRALVQLTWTKHRVQCEEKNKVLKKPPGMGGCHIKPSYVCLCPISAADAEIQCLMFCVNKSQGCFLW